MSPLAIHSRQEHIRWLALAAGALFVLPHVPLGNYLLYPFMILSTWFHEMGHGLTAMAVGFQFERLVLFPNGSGFAETLRPVNASSFSQALVAAGGPIGPAIVGSLLILASTKAALWRPTLYILAGAIVLSTLIWVRSMIGWIVLPSIALVLVVIAAKGAPWLERFALQFLGLSAALSMFQQWDYLLTERAVVGGQEILSDTGAIEEYLLLPHWIWAGGIITLAALMIGASLRYALSDKRIPKRWDSGF
ncbi:M50 family metallopeptidase [Parerythrobacter jejuensis]|uniref:M50 family peptidase n=1 Tax=Parerythrobacter jejuensis TaxID=795812 RepID=A0A845ARR1_9SPHN|nr:M50 family metallopeptidase [Parerythrobacter jejuensis]MXP31196.1 M50 family peptidase [Parerythrobacter jejuensis]MXP33956.1 M50 family peptidase [Parerythrobacter jejuensis]